MCETLPRKLRLFLLLSMALLVVVLSGGLLARVSAASVRPGTITGRATAPAIQISPNSGKYGTETVVTGQGFGPNEQVAIYKGTRPFFAYQTDANGSFVGSPHPLIGPGPVSGIITIKGTGRTTGLSASTTFTVTQ